MRFKHAYAYAKHGRKIRCPEWGGYWYWCPERQVLMIHTRDNEELAFTETKDFDFTMSFVFRDDWELIDE